MNLEKRIRALEGRLTLKYITLTMPDGSEHKIPGDGQHLLKLACDAMNQAHARGLGEPVPASEFAAELGLISKSVSCDENGEMVNLARIALRSPIGDVEANRVAELGDDGDE